MSIRVRLNQLRTWWSHRTGTDLEITFQGVVALATIAYVTITSVQLCQLKAATKQTKRAANAAKSAADTAAAALKATTDQFQTDERPYVVAEYIRLAGKPAIGEKLAAEVQWNNTGKTPALKLSSYLKIDVLRAEPPAPDQWAFLAESQHDHLELGSNLSRGVPVIGKDALDTVWLNRITDRTYHVYVFGAVYYEDVFKHWHDSRVCGRYEPDSYNELFLWACSGAGTDNVD